MDLIKDLLYHLYYKVMLPSHINIQKGARLINTDLSKCEDLLIQHNSIIGNSTIQKKIIIERNCRIKDSILKGYNRICNLSYLNVCHLDEFSYVSRDTWLSHIKIGKFCSLGSRIIAGRGAHPTDFLSTSPFFYSTKKQTVISGAQQDLFTEIKEITVGNDVWIGDNTFVMDGITIGNGAIIGAGSVVTRDIPPYAIYAGNPAKLIRYRFEEETINKIEKLNWWNWDLNKIKSNIQLFQKTVSNKELLSIFSQLK